MSIKKKDKKLLETAIDKVIEKFNDNSFLSQDFEEYSKMLREEYYKSQNIRKKIRNCCMIGCKEEAIKKSHSIPKSSVLKNISYNNHVLTPKYDFKNDFPKIKMASVGINNASVFPGYCIKHENIFNIYEHDGEIDNAIKALLQTYRTIAKERVYRDIELEISEKIKKKYINKINKEAQEYLIFLLKDYPQFSNINELKIEGIDSVLSIISKQANFLRQPNDQFLLFEKYILAYLLGISINSDLIVEVMKIDIEFPISLCGIGSQSFMHFEHKKDLLLLLNVMPLKNSTYIICAGLEQNLGILDKFLNFSFENPINVLNFIESFMVNSSDFWFINPNYWNNFSEEKQDKILYDILFTNDSFLDEYNYSIFDDIRIKLLTILEENIKSRGSSITENEKKRIKAEYLKLKNKNYYTIKDK
ncbi:hypothetical protein ACTS9K_10465 [Empedobacter sp. ULE_I145]|uniref:hypothetical protein n=1 Tax=Empedobacter sp. TaxID=1927715 RepID=UPI0028B10E56|nr:hypothetical protein [Empedobacter sp.]